MAGSSATPGMSPAKRRSRAMRTTPESADPGVARRAPQDPQLQASGPGISRRTPASRPTSRPRPRRRSSTGFLLRTGISEWHGEKRGGPLGQPAEAHRLQLARGPQAGRRDRPAVRPGHRRLPEDPGPVHRGSGPPMAIHRLLAVDLRRRRPAGAADLDHELPGTPRSCSRRCRSSKGSASWRRKPSR